MTDVEIAGAAVGVLLYVVIAIIGIIITVSPYFCWRYLKSIRELQKEEALRVDSHLCAIRRSLDSINAAMLHIAKATAEEQ